MAYRTGPTLTTITSGNFTPQLSGQYRISCVGGGGGGGGGSGAAAGAGGGGGGCGGTAEQIQTLVAGTTYTCTLGAGGATAAGGASGIAGTNGNPGGQTTFAGSDQHHRAMAAVGAKGAQPRALRVMALPAWESTIPAALFPPAPVGVAFVLPLLWQRQGSTQLGLAAGGGGAGGVVATAKGGGGGGAGAYGVLGAAGTNGTSGTTGGVIGVSAAANTGAGGGGGGCGDAATGGGGGVGGSGFIVILGPLP